MTPRISSRKPIPILSAVRAVDGDLGKEGGEEIIQSAWLAAKRRSRY